MDTDEEDGRRKDHSGRTANRANPTNREKKTAAPELAIFPPNPCSLVFFRGLHATSLVLRSESANTTGTGGIWASTKADMGRAAIE